MDESHAQATNTETAKGLLANPCALLCQADRTIYDSRITFAEIREMTWYVAEIERLHAWPADEATGPSMHKLREPFLDLEGKIKELRNDRTMKS